ncbi:hypothetical protein ABI59_09290 [Acidobacteria bacterium Mor1]|nr:hypothetical protein ABI59_09290 [Acidobacteria bacterium Mor1]
MSHCDKHVDVRSLAPTAVGLLEYLTRRIDCPHDEPEPEVSLELRIEAARTAQLQLRRLAVPVLRGFRRDVASGESAQLFNRIVKACGKKVVPADLVSRALEQKVLRSLFDREGVHPDLIHRVAAMIEKSQTTIRSQKGGLRVSGPFGAANVVSDQARPLMFGEDRLLDLLARTWLRRGRGLLSLTLPARDRCGEGEPVAWSEYIGAALVHADWFFDREIRTLQDTGSSPALDGNDAVGAVVSLVLFVAGLVLLAVAECVDDPDVRDLLRVLGGLLIASAVIVGAESGVPVTVCRVDPMTGLRECTRI